MIEMCVFDQLPLDLGKGMGIVIKGPKILSLMMEELNEYLNIHSTAS